MISTYAASASTSNSGAREYHILMIEDSQTKRFLPLNYATYSGGRDSSNVIRLNDPGASRLHFMLIRKPASNHNFCYQIIDGDVKGKPSLNGLTINGQSYSKKDLASGDVIRIGESTTLRYMLQVLTEEKFNWHFSRQQNPYQRIPDSSTDPTETMTTTLLG